MAEIVEKSPSQRPPIEWSTAIMFVLTTLAAITLVPWYGLVEGYSTTAWVTALVLWIYCGTAIGSGYHRLWSHRTYKAHWALRVFYALGGALALQNSALNWCARHRVHHRHVDIEDKDPHSIKLGFWHAHMGWMLRDHECARANYGNVPDLKNDPIVMWQHRNYWSLTWFMNLGVPAIIGWIAGDLWGVILLGGVLRLVVNHQVTFFINSLAHMWGKQPYSDESTARDNWFLAMITFGEGYHNFHHTFQADYRNGVRWWQIDWNKWFLNGVRLVGLGWDFKKTPRFRVLRAKLAMDFINARKRLTEEATDASWKETLDREYQQFLETVKAFQELQKGRVQSARQSLRERWEANSLRTRMKELEYSLKMQRKRVSLLTAALSTG
ncbi:MAG: fatty acid desaturase [Xanthomonadales bacterium]|nr:fatty acid desaturase [Xanthomonadales bacterium]